MDIPGTLAAIGSALTVVKELREIDGQLDKAEMKLKIADITGALADARHGIVDAEEILKAKDREIERLSELFAYRAERTTRYKGFTYEKAEDEDRPVGLPFCTVCEQGGRLIRLVELNKEGRPAVCPKCKADFGHQTEWSWTRR